MLQLGLFSFALIAPALPNDADADLPACCRRDGKHACGMRMERTSPSGSAWQTARCPSFPAVKGLPAARAVAAPPGTPHCALAAPATVGHARYESAPVVRATRYDACRKRGPPTLG